MHARPPIRLPSIHDFSHDAQQLILATGLIAVSFFGVFSLLRSLYLLRLGFGPPYVGIYFAAGSLTFMAMGMPSGLLGQRLGTRTAMLAGAWITLFGMALMPALVTLVPRLSHIWPLVSQVVLTVGWSMVNVNTVPALMAVTHERNRSSAYAMSSALRGIGTLAGTLIGGALPGLFAGIAGLSVDDPAPYSYALLSGAALGLLAIPSLAKVRGGQRARTGDPAEKERGPFPLLLVAAMIVYVFLRHTGWTTCQAFCTPYMDAELRISTAAIGTITGAGQVAAILATFLIPRLAERWHHGWIVAASTAIQVASLTLLTLVPDWFAVAVGLLGVQLSSALWLPALQVFQMEQVSEGWRGLSYGAVTMAMGSGFGAMSLFGGYFIQARGYPALFTLGIVLSAGGTVVMSAISRRVTRSPLQLPPAGGGPDATRGDPRQPHTPLPAGGETDATRGDVRQPHTHLPPRGGPDAGCQQSRSAPTGVEQSHPNLKEVSGESLA
jgi:MFS family permease